MTPHQFIEKWNAADLKERSASQSHFNDLCTLLGIDDPVTADPTGDWFTFEKGASKTTGGEGWAANRMRFIAAPARAVLIWSYWWGEPVVTGVWEQVPTARRREFIRYLYGRMHSLATVQMFL